MSDLCIYELQDNVWDEFGESGDHIVPQPVDEAGIQFAIQTDSHKKLRVDKSGISSDANRSTNYSFVGKREESSLTPTKRDKMLERSSWSPTDDSGFPSCNGDPVKETANVACDDSRMAGHYFKSGSASELCTADVLGERSAAVDNNLYHYSLNHASETESSLSFFDNEVKEGNDLYYEWPDIGNLEDVNKMFRNCDSTFGLGSLTNDDDLGWFGPSHAIEGSEDALDSEFQFSCPEPTELRSVSENQRDSGPDRGDFAVNDPKARNPAGSDNLSSQITCAREDASFDHLRFVNGLDTTSGSKGDSSPKEEMNLHRKQSKWQHPLEGKRKDRYLENGHSFQHYNLSEQTMQTKTPFGNQAHQLISPSNYGQHKHDERSDRLASMQMQRYISADYHHHVGQTPEYPTSSGIKCENNSQPSPSPNGSSYTSNQVQSPHGNFKAPSARIDGSESLHNNQHFQGNNFIHMDGSSSAVSDPVAVLKQVHQTENDTDGHSEVDRISIGVRKELDTSLVQDGSCLSSLLDEISLEATSFRQLQQVMEQLDIRTKLCIRDSLYRLARSAEQRHNFANPNGGNRKDDAQNGAAVMEESNECNGFMDIETDTNPIDRSVAHLLFHRPSDPSLVPGSNDVSSPKSNAMRCATSMPPTMNERENHVEEGSIDVEKIMS